MRRSSQRTVCGFTLIEMIVVITLVLILLAIAAPIYSQSLRRAREDNLRKNLWTLNQMIAQYTLDKQKAPLSLDDLRHAGYIDTIPEDITGRPDTWVPEEDDSIMSPDQTDPGWVGVHSGSNLTALDGSPYSSW